MKVVTIKWSLKPTFNIKIIFPYEYLKLNRNPWDTNKPCHPSHICSKAHGTDEILINCLDLKILTKVINSNLRTFQNKILINSQPNTSKTASLTLATHKYKTATMERDKMVKLKKIPKIKE